jgi:hypothetical protein
MIGPAEPTPVRRALGQDIAIALAGLSHRHSGPRIPAITLRKQTFRF